MWIFTKTGVLSVVEFDPTNGYADDGVAPRDNSKLMVRARQAEHLTSVGFSEREIVETPNNDYPFRVITGRERVAQLVLLAVMSIDYENYKAEACKALPYGMLSEVWSSVRLHLDSREIQDTPF
jgi:hypothetical protein